MPPQPNHSPAVRWVHYDYYIIINIFGNRVGIQRLNLLHMLHLHTSRDPVAKTNLLHWACTHSDCCFQQESLLFGGGLRTHLVLLFVALLLDLRGILVIIPRSRIEQAVGVGLLGGCVVTGGGLVVHLRGSFVNPRRLRGGHLIGRRSVQLARLGKRLRRESQRLCSNASKTTRGLSLKALQRGASRTQRHLFLP